MFFLLLNCTIFGEAYKTIMQKENKVNKEKIENLVYTFRSKTIGEISPKNTCFHVSYGLHLHLKNNGIENSLRTGTCESIKHYWINLEHNKEVIIDATIGQFSFAKNIPYYIGQKPSCYIENLDFSFTDPKYDNNILCMWLSQFIHSRSFIEEGDITKSQLEDLLQINIKSAIIINNEIEENLNIEIKKYKRYSDYFDGIKVLLDNYTNEKQIKEFLNIKGFNNLHLKVCGHLI